MVCDGVGHGGTVVMLDEACGGDYGDDSDSDS